MSIENNGLRFDIYERVNLPENVAAIEELEEIELVPRIQVIDQGEFVLLQGQLVLNGIYRGEGFGQDQIALEHWIPVEISLPINRVRQLEEITVDIDTFHVEPVSERALNITGVLALRGIYLEEQEQNWHEQNDYEELSFVAQSNSEEQQVSWRSDEGEAEIENREQWFVSNEQYQKQVEQSANEWRAFAESDEAQSESAESAQYDSAEYESAQYESAEYELVESEAAQYESAEYETAESEAAHYESANYELAEREADEASSLDNSVQWQAKEEVQQLNAEQTQTYHYNTYEQVDVAQQNNRDDAYVEASFEAASNDEQVFYSEADMTSATQEDNSLLTWQAAEPEVAKVTTSFGIKDILSSSLREQAAHELQRLDAERERLQRQLQQEESEQAQIDWRHVLLQADGKEQFRKIKMYIVQKNDTLELIAGKYSVNPRDLLQHNKLHETSISAGQLLYIP